jgi:two-component system, NarL family, nitrate/nitrite response regulator NarL
MADAPAKIRILLVDDHPLVREGIRSCLSAVPHFEVVGEATDGRMALRRARTLAPDVVLMDLSMPQLDGIAATERLRQMAPHIRVLVLTVHDRREYLLQIVRSGAHGHVSKNASPRQLIRAIAKVARGGLHFSAETLDSIMGERMSAPGRLADARKRLLSAREGEVLVLVAEGLGYRQIAARLSVGVRTVETHRERIMRKLDIHSVAGLTRYAVARGLVRPE